MNYYMVLGIAEDADRDTVRSAFRAMARRYHPDAGGAGASPDAFRRVVEAYETLHDPARRRVYDRALHHRTVRSPRQRERFVEPLSNRIRVDSIVSTGFRTIGDRRPVNSIQAQIDVDEILEALILDLTCWPPNRRRGF